MIFSCLAASRSIPFRVLQIDSPSLVGYFSNKVCLMKWVLTSEHVSSVLAGLQNASIPNFKLIHGLECENYELGGEQACSIIHNGDKKGTNTPSLTNATIIRLYSLLDSSLYNIIYNAPALDFNKNLDILRPMLSSFETLNGPDDMPSIPRFQNLTVQ